MNCSVLNEAYRSIAQFHENERLIARVQSWKIIGWLTPNRRRHILFIGAFFAGVAGVLNRYAPWREYRHAGTWFIPAVAFAMLLAIVYLLYLMALHFKRLPKVVRVRPQICCHLFFWALLLVIWSAPDSSGFDIAVISLIALSFPVQTLRTIYFTSGRCGMEQIPHPAKVTITSREPKRRPPRLTRVLSLGESNCFCLCWFGKSSCK
jgi:MFS family permease